MTEVFGQGVQLMLVGMAVVFVLLGFLVLAVKGMSRLALAVGGPAGTSDLTPPATPVAPAESEVIAAVTAAVHLYRKGVR